MFALYTAFKTDGCDDEGEWKLTLIAIVTTEDQAKKMLLEYVNDRFHEGKRCDCDDDEYDECHGPCMCFPLVLDEIGEPNTFIEKNTHHVYNNLTCLL